jgi:proline iminopeptidase
MAGVRWVPTEDGELLWTATDGEGPPLVLCHGGPGMWDYLEPIGRAVEDLVTVHRWEQRGSGRSTTSGPYTIARFVTDLEALRVHFGHDRWTVGGHSWGATLALHYAFAYPERVVALLYLSGTGVGRAWHHAYHAEADRRLSAEQRRRRDELKDRRRNEAEEREWRTLNGAPDFADREGSLDLAATQYASDLLPINYECNAALGAETKTWREDDLLAHCQMLDMPVLLVHGAEDPRPAWALDSLIAALPRAELRLLDGVGHMPWVEDLDGLRSVVRAFLRSLPGVGAPVK